MSRGRGSRNLIEILLPRTDAGVLVQLLLTLAVGGPIVLAAHRRGISELTWFAGGIVVLLLGLFALRTIH